MNPQDTPQDPKLQVPPALPAQGAPQTVTRIGAAPPQAAATPPAPAAPPEEPLPENPDAKTVFEALLRRPGALAAHLNSDGKGATRRFLGLTVVSFLLFGVVLGCFAKHQQLWAAPVKVTLGLLFSAAICFPSLFIFATLAGARVAAGQLAACLAGALALAGLLLLGFAPALWIFAESTDSLGFMGFLTIVSWGVALFFALRFIRTVVTAAGGLKSGPVIIWSLIFLLVTLQMTTTLRPILGRSDAFLSQEKKFFLQHWGETAGESLANPKPTDGHWDGRVMPGPSAPSSSPDQGESGARPDSGR